MKPRYVLSLPILAIAALAATGAQQSTAVAAEQSGIKPPALDTTPGASVNSPAKAAHYLRLHNVSPRIVAWWLDPINNPEPIEYTGKKGRAWATPDVWTRTTTGPVVTSSSKPKGTFELPKGVDQIIAIDPQNALLVYGTEEGVRQLETIVKYLDKPIPQIEIEAQFVEVSAESARAFGIDWSGARNSPFSTDKTAGAAEPGTFSLGYPRGNLPAALKAAIAEKKVKLLSAPRVMALNNFTSSVFTQTSFPAVIGIKDAGGNFTELLDASDLPTSARPRFSITTRFSFTVTPTINNDKTITLVMQPARTVLLAMGDDLPVLYPLRNLQTQSVQTIVNLRDGDTIAMGGLRSFMTKTDNPLIPENATTQPGGNMILFVTARIVRRADDSTAATTANP